MNYTVIVAEDEELLLNNLVILREYESDERLFSFLIYYD